MRSRARRALLLAAIAVCAALTPVALLEAGLRIAGYGYASAFFVRLPGAQAYTANQRFGRRFFPTALARTPVAERFDAVKPPGTYRIFVLGESAAMGFPEPGFSFGRHLEMMLRRMYPDLRIEVIHATLTAINSHVLAAVARDCARLEPDVFLVYMGNNEVVGPYGSGTVFSGFSGSLRLIRGSIWLSGTRTGQLLAAAGRRWRDRGSEPSQWRGMEMFLGHAVAADDPRMSAVYANLRRNLADICRTGRRAGAHVIVATVPVNLKDSPPFASVHRPGFSEFAASSWNREYEAGNALAARGAHAEALERFAAAAKLDDGFAGLHFRAGQSLLALGRMEEARRELARARDLDALRFRADSRMNQILRETARANGARLVDAEQLFALREIPGGELFYEHVHLNPAGNDLLARLFLPEIAALSPGSRRGVEPAAGEVSRDLARTSWDEYRSLADIAAMMKRPPFTNQFDHARRQAELARRLESLRRESTAPAALESAKAVYAAVLRERPDDLAVRQRFADLLAIRGELSAAAAEWGDLLAKVPDVDAWRLALGAVLAGANRRDEALTEYRRVLRSDPQSAAAEFGIASVFQQQRRYTEAARHYEAALRLNPNYAEAENNLGLMRMDEGDAGGAAAHYRKALQSKPDFPEAHNNLAAALGALGDWRGAVGEYERALALKPDFAGARANLAGALARSGRLREAAAAYEQALAAQPDSFEARRGLAALLSESGDLPRAAAQLAYAARLRPESPSVRYDLGSVLSRQGKLEEAVAQLTEALRLSPRYPEAWNNLGSALARQGHMDRAIACFRKALELRPGYSAAEGNLNTALSLRAQARGRR
jgi:tetratricopeptide (TPR) repeat protein